MVLAASGTSATSDGGGSGPGSGSRSRSCSRVVEVVPDSALSDRGSSCSLSLFRLGVGGGGVCVCLCGSRCCCKLCYDRDDVHDDGDHHHHDADDDDAMMVEGDGGCLVRTALRVVDVHDYVDLVLYILCRILCYIIYLTTY